MAGRRRCFGMLPYRVKALELLEASGVRLPATIAILFLVAASSHAGEFSTQILAEVNLARTQPQHYAQIVEGRFGSGGSSAVREAVRFLQKAKPLRPLAYSTGLNASAWSHVADAGPRGAMGHSGSGGSSPFSRMSRQGRWIGRAGENIYYGPQDARGIVVALIIDEGVFGRGHRKNIFSPAFAVAGVAHGGHARYGAMCVMDFATGFTGKDLGRVAGL